MNFFPARLFSDVGQGLILVRLCGKDVAIRADFPSSILAFSSYPEAGRVRSCWTLRALAQFGKQCTSRIGVGLAGIGRIGPHRVIDNLRGILSRPYEGSFAHVHAFLQAIVTRFANGSRFGALMIFAHSAHQWRIRHFGVSGENCDLNSSRKASRSCSTTAVSGVASTATCAFRTSGATVGETLSLLLQFGQVSRFAG